MNTKQWQCLEAIPGLSAVSSVWRRYLEEDFEPFKTAFLQAKPDLVKSFPCDQCGCAHRVIALPSTSARSHTKNGGIQREASATFLAVCQCSNQACPHLELTRADFTALELNRARLGRAIGRAFDLDLKPAILSIPNTLQIGSWSADAVPAILTLQTDRHVFRRVISELALRLNAPFILFTPTSGHVDAICQELVAQTRAALFALDAHVILTPGGAFRPINAAGELFSRFAPQPKERLDNDAARRAFALIQQLDSKSAKPPSPLTVFRLYCMEEESVDRIAHRCRCSKGTVSNRLAWIRSKTGMNPDSLRRISTHLEAQKQATGSRVQRIHGGRPIHDDEEPDEFEG